MTRELEINKLKFRIQYVGGSKLYALRGHTGKSRQDVGRERKTGPQALAFIRVPVWSAGSPQMKARLVSSHQESGFW